MNFQKKKTCLPGCWEYAEKRLAVCLSVTSPFNQHSYFSSSQWGQSCNWVKLVLLTTQQPISQVTRNLGKERNFTQKSSKPRRWQTSVIKKPPWERRNSGFFYVRVRRFKVRGDWWLHTSGYQQGPRGMVKLQTIVAMVSARGFWKYFDKQ